MPGIKNKHSIYAIFLVLSLIVISCNSTPYMQGQRLYTSKCQNCHMEDGTGGGLYTEEWHQRYLI